MIRISHDLYVTWPHITELIGWKWTILECIASHLYYTHFFPFFNCKMDFRTWNGFHKHAWMDIRFYSMPIWGKYLECVIIYLSLWTTCDDDNYGKRFAWNGTEIKIECSWTKNCKLKSWNHYCNIAKIFFDMATFRVFCCLIKSTLLSSKQTK